jgi:hypothetical protein
MQGQHKNTGLNDRFAPQTVFYGFGNTVGHEVLSRATDARFEACVFRITGNQPGSPRAINRVHHGLSTGFTTGNQTAIVDRTPRQASLM